MSTHQLSVGSLSSSMLSAPPLAHKMIESTPSWIWDAVEDVAIGGVKHTLSNLRFVSEALTGTHVIKVDIKEGIDAYLVVAETPGVPKECIKIEISAGPAHCMRISTRPAPPAHDPGAWLGLRAECSAAKALERELRIPPGVAFDKITADLEDGLLSIRLPKLVPTAPAPAAQAPPSTIIKVTAVSAAGGGAPPAAGAPPPAAGKL